MKDFPKHVHIFEKSQPAIDFHELLMQEWVSAPQRNYVFGGSPLNLDKPGGGYLKPTENMIFQSD